MIGRRCDANHPATFSGRCACDGYHSAHLAAIWPCRWVSSRDCLRRSGTCGPERGDSSGRPPSVGRVRGRLPPGAFRCRPALVVWIDVPALSALEAETICSLVGWTGGSPFELAQHLLRKNFDRTFLTRGSAKAFWRFRQNVGSAIRLRLLSSAEKELTPRWMGPEGRNGDRCSLEGS